MSRACILAAAALAACSDSASTPHQYAAVVRGTLSTTDLAAAQAMHDQIAAAGEPTANQRGDFAHAVLLGVPILDGVTNEFLAIDRWTDGDAMEAFYTGGFGTLFTGAPTIEFFEAQTDWTQWGDMHAGEPFDPYFFHFALGELALDTVAANRDAHNMVAGGGMAPAVQAGAVAHVVFLGKHDAERFLAVDIWNASTAIEAFYTNPQFVAAFAPLFSSIEQPVYQSTTWHQW